MGMSAECGVAAQCVGFLMMGNCFATCATDADCRMGEGYTCGSLPAGGPSTGLYCIPPIGGTGFP